MLNWILSLCRGAAGPRFSGPVDLPVGQVHRLWLRAGERLEVHRGRLWLTREGDPTDHLLTPGVGYVAAFPQEVVLESLLGSASCYERDALSRPSSGRHEAPLSSALKER